MKRKGSLLIGVILLVTIVAILSIPILNTIGVTSNLKTQNVVVSKAEEIAYCGYMIIEKYIVENEDDFISSLNNNVFEIELDIPYTFTNNSKTATIIANAKIEDNKLTEVTITSTATFSGEEGVYQDTIYFNSENQLMSNVFPEDEYFEEDSIDNMLDRVGVTEIPTLLGDEHISYLKRNSNFIETVNDGQFGSITRIEQDDINNFISALKAQDNGLRRNHIIFINPNQYYNATQLFTYTYNVDLTGLQSPEGAPNFIIVIKGDLQSWDIASFNITGGNMYILADNMTSVASFASVTADEVKKTGQLTIASLGSGGVIEFERHNMTNTFYYLPNREVRFKTYDWETDRENSGALVVDDANNLNSDKINFLNEKWNGTNDILGFIE
ncbi:MAG: hypothetical protein ACK5LY_00285 [Lachnospirales bacterium]